MAKQKKRIYIGKSYGRNVAVAKRKPKMAIRDNPYSRSKYFNKYFYGTKTIFVPKRGYILVLPKRKAKRSKKKRR